MTSPRPQPYLHPTPDLHPSTPPPPPPRHRPGAGPGAARRRRLLHLTLAVLSLLVPAVAPTSQGAAAETPAAETPAPETSAPETPAAEAPWLRDDQGREYRLEPLPKEDGFQPLEGGRLLTRWGIAVEVEGEDEDHYYYRVYRRPATGGHGPRRPSPSALGALPPPAGIGAVPARAFLQLTAITAGLPRAAQWRNGFRLVDLDGDGWLDLALPPARKRIGGPLLLRGGGDGWRPWDEARFVLPPDTGPAWDYGDVEAADLDGDGRTDLAFAMHLRGVAAFVQRDGGVFTAWSGGLPLARGAGGAPSFSGRALRAADLDGDGRPELAVLGEGLQLAPGSAPGTATAGALGLWRWMPPGEGPGDGAAGAEGARDGGGWRDAGPVAGSETLFGQALAAGDADGDGRTDLLASSDAAAPRGLLVLARDGGPAAAELPLPDGFRLVAAAVGGAPGRHLALVLTGFDGTAWSSSLEILSPAAGEGWRRETVLRLPGAYALGAVHLADLDGDGGEEVVLGTGDGRLAFLRRAGDGWERDPVEVLPATPGCRVFHVESGLDRDGSRLLVVNRAGEEKGGMLGPALAGCPGGGGIHAWRVGVAPAAPGAP